MRKLLLASVALMAVPVCVITSQGANAAVIFPKIGSSTNGPAITFTFTDAGITTQNLSTQTYDGSDDVEVGVINSSSIVQTFLTLSGSGNGGGIFAFDGDGITGYTDANTGKNTIGNPADPTGYAGPGVTYSGINVAQTSGTVNFSLSPGAFTYFGLEGSPASIGTGGGIVVGGGGGTSVPEPASIAMMLVGLVAARGLYRRRSSF